MEAQITNFIQGLVSQCLNSSAFVNLPDDQKAETLEKLTEYFHDLMVKTLLDNLNADQLNQIKDLDFKSPEMEEKLEQFGASIPGFAFTLDQKLKDEAARISQTGQIPSL